MFYSASTGGFYSTEVHGNNMPSDVVSITAEQYQALLIGQSQGKQITAGQGGPVLTDPPAPAQNPAAQIEALERQYQLARPVREFMLISMEVQAAAQGISPTELRERNPGYRRVKELDEQIAALRELL